MRLAKCWQLVAALLVAGALAGCSTQTPPTGTEKSPSTAGGTTAAAPAAPAASPTQFGSTSARDVTAASPVAAASPTTSAAPVAKAASPVARVEPKGRATYAYQASISPAWFDPFEYQTPTASSPFLYLMHDALIKSMPGNVYSPSLAESYEIAPDSKSATFRLRANAKFHDGSPVTAEDVKFSYENYKGINAKVFKDKTATIETPDARTVKFTFKEPFFDFLFLYGTPASAAGWVVPAKYYQQVGPDGFKQRPIGAGPYKFVSLNGDILETEAFTDYWRKTPSVKTFIYRGIPDPATRVAAMKAGEIDFTGAPTGPLSTAFDGDTSVKRTFAVCCPYFLVFPQMDKPESPYSNIKVREAISLAIDRKAISDAELGFDAPLAGNWIPEDVPGAIKLPVPQPNVDRAKKLLAEAGFPTGFDGGQLTPYPQYESMGERVITQLRALGIQLTLNQMERGAFVQRFTQGTDAFPRGIVMNNTGPTGDAAARIRAYSLCPPKGSNSLTCDARIDELFAKVEGATSVQARQQALEEIQRYMYDQAMYPTLSQAISRPIQGPRIANEPKDILAAFPQYTYVAPVEDVLLKE